MYKVQKKSVPCQQTCLLLPHNIAKQNKEELGARLRNVALRAPKLRLRPINREEMLRICRWQPPMGLGTLAPSNRLYKCSVQS